MTYGHPIHVLHVVPGLTPGGLELAMARVIRGLGGPQMQHSVVCLKGEPVIRDRFDPSVPIYCMHTGSNDPRLPLQLRQLVQQVRPTVIHARNWSAWPDIALARLLLWHKVPLIISFHGFDSAAAMPLRRRIATRLIAATATRVFTVTEASRRLMVEHIGLPDDRVEVIPNGVDVERFKPGQPRAAQRRIVVGTVGSLSPVKNHALLVRACALANQAGTEVELRIAGEGTERAALTELIHSLNLEGRAHLPGHQRDVPAFLNSLDIFVLPSDSEAHPNALLEAMACGLPCIGTHVGGLPEVLGFGQCGRLVERGDADGLSRAIIELASDPGARKTLGRAARTRVLEQYSMDHMLRAYNLLYREPGVVRHLPPDNTKAASAQKPRVLMLGPLPPLMGGMVTVTDNLRRSALSERCRLMVMNNGKTTPQGRSLVAGIKAQADLLWNVVRCVPRRRVQIVHIHTIQFFGFWRDCVHMAAAKLLGSHVVLHMHGASFDQWAESMGPVRRRLLRLVLEMASGVIVLSHQWQEKLRPYAPGARWHVVPNGVRLPDLVGGLSRPEPSFLFLGDWTKRKGVRDLVSAAALAMRKRFTGMVDLAGFEKERGQREALDRHVAELGCQARVRVLGALSGKAKEEALAGADCLVLPSYAEGLPMAVLEAMAYGLPVIATRVGAIPEAVTDGQEGFLIEPGDVEALADRLLQLAEDVSLRRRMGQAARRRAETTFSLDAMAEHVMQVYRALLNPRDPAHETDQAPENRCPHPQDAP